MLSEKHDGKMAKWRGKPGGPRPGAGRKPLEGTDPVMKSVKLCAEHWDIAQKIGDGNRAEGIRRALDDYGELEKLRMSVARIAQALKINDPMARDDADLHRRACDEPRGWNLLAASCVDEVERCWSAAQQEERERCAKIVEQGPDNGISYQALWRLAAAIRDAS